MSFEGKNTQLYPVVNIGDNWYSTNNTTVEFEGVSYYCKPILMNIPSIKESIDIESRKFKISSVSLQFSNYVADGERFSDQLTDSSLINVEATIYYKSPSEMLEVYKGVIRSISHDDEKVSIQLEDLTEKKAHKDLPQEFLGDGDNIPDKSKNKPIPIVYGHVDKSPVLPVESFTEFIIDSKDIDGVNSEDSGFTHPSYINTELNPAGIIFLGSLLLHTGDKYLNVVEDGQYIAQDNVIKLDSTNNTIFPLPSNNEQDEVNLLVNDNNHDFNLSVSNVLRDDSLQSEDFFVIGDVNKLNDGSYDPNLSIISNPSDGYLVQDGNYIISPLLGYIERLFVSIDINYQPSYDYLKDTIIDGVTYTQVNNIIGFKINNKNIQNVIGKAYSYANTQVLHTAVFALDDIQNPQVGSYDTISGTSSSYTGIGFPITGSVMPTINNVFNFGIANQQTNTNAPINLIYSRGDSNNINFDYENALILFYGVPKANTLAIQFRGIYNVSSSSDDFTLAPNFELSGDLNEIELLREVKVTKPFSKEYYANVNGRLDEVGNFITNPIDIIKHLVEVELGIDAFDDNDFLLAKTAHSDWQFGFTINKKINSKKLIAEIAKSTKCFPVFKNDGTFGFNTILDEYPLEDDSYIEIKESEVISYSFKKTKPEQIYKKVDVQYKKDYAQDSYLKRTDEIDLGSDDYYGIEDSVDSCLEFESDYIREESTALLLRQFLSEQYKNDHLIFNLKLPLQYIDLEIGNIVKFNTLFQGIKAYGIDYTQEEVINDQLRYPLFMVTSTQKNLDSVQIECMQLHNLSGITEPVDYVAYDGDDIEISGNVIDRLLGAFTIGVVDTQNFEDFLGDSEYFRISGVSGVDIVKVEHTYSESADYQNTFVIRNFEEQIDGSLLAVEDINFELSLEDEQQLTITLSSFIPSVEFEGGTGDVNDDGILNVLDVVMMVNVILENTTFTEQQIQAGDMNQDGGLNVLDVVTAVNQIIG